MRSIPKLFMNSSQKLKLAIATLGCKTNYFESAGIAEGFPNAEIVDFSEPADIYIVNSCTVTNRTDYKSRNLIRKALAQKAKNPQIKIVVTGCFAQRSAAEVAALGDIDYIVDNQAKLDIAGIIQGDTYSFGDIMQARDFAYKPIHSMLGHTRAFQKIQDGCDFYCSYCAVPYARGHSRSARFIEVLQQAQLFVGNGFREIVLGGVNVGLYRDGDKGLGDVVKAMAEIPELKLIRISSLEPQLFTPEILAAFKDTPKICPHFHIPLQSGSDTILKTMGRRYDTALVQGLTRDILRAFPDAAIGFDVICGFPSETQELFEQTLAFLQSLPLAYLHVFSYSARKQTPAATLPDQVPGNISSNRSRILSALSAKKKAQYATHLRELNPVLRGVIEQTHDNYSESLSDHYLRVRLPQTLEIGDFFNAATDELEFVID